MNSPNRPISDRPDAWTAGKLLDWAVRDFTGRGLSEPRLSAEVLLSHAMNATRVSLYLRYDEPMGEEVRRKFRELLEERRRGMPVAYITGEKEFYSLPLSVDPRVLIPRPETEFLVDETLAYLKRKSLEAPAVVDVGTGSGAVAIALKKEFPASRVTGLDISAEALDVARENARKIGVEIEWACSDLLRTFDSAADVLAANLPYIPTADFGGLDVSVRDFEPRLALDGGADGLDLIRRLAEELPRNRRPGAVFLEVGAGQAEDVGEILKRAGYPAVAVRCDYSGIPRIVMAEADRGA